MNLITICLRKQTQFYVHRIITSEDSILDKNTAPSIPMIEKLMRLNGYEQRLRDYFEDYSLLIALPYMIDQEKSDELKAQYARPEEMRKMFFDVYSKHFTADDILNIIAFLRTPTGQKFVEHDEIVRGELQKGAMKIATDIAIEMVQDNIKKRRDSDLDLNLPEIP